MGKHMDDCCSACNLWMPGSDHDRFEEEVAICNGCGHLVHRGCLEPEYGEMCRPCWDQRAEEEDLLL
jgi:hypothetical protein